MEKKMIFMERLFCVLSIIFYLVGMVLLIVNCFTDVLFYTCFVYIFVFIFFLNQVFFIPGRAKIKDREYKNNSLYLWQYYVAMAILAAFLFINFFDVTDQVYVAIFGCLLMIFLIIFALQNILYTFHYDKKKKLNFKKSLFFSIFFTTFLLIFLLCWFISSFRGYYV